MDFNIVGATIGIVLATSAAAAAIVLAPLFGRLQRVILRPYEERLERIVRRGLRPGRTEPINDKLDRVAALSSEMARLNSEVSEELRRSLAETARLKGEAEVARNLASLNQGQRDAVVAVLNQGEGRNRVFQVVVAFIFFVLGVGAGVFVPGWINALFPSA